MEPDGQNLSSTLAGAGNRFESLDERDAKGSGRFYRAATQGRVWNRATQPQGIITTV